MSAASPVAETDARQVSSEKKSAGFVTVLVTSVLTAAGTAGLGLFGQYYASLWEDQRHRRIEEVTQFVEAAQRYDGLVANYITKLDAKGDTSKERSALHDNILVQWNLLDTAKANLDAPQNKRAGKYQDDLSAVGEHLDEDFAAPDAAPLMQAIATTKADSICVIYDLRKQAKLPTVTSDKARCETF